MQIAIETYFYSVLCFIATCILYFQSIWLFYRFKTCWNKANICSLLCDYVLHKHI